MLILVPFLERSYQLLFFENLVRILTFMYGRENPQNSLTANILTHQHKQECHTVFILCITTEGRLSIFILKVLRDGKRRDSLFVLHDSELFQPD